MKTNPTLFFKNTILVHESAAHSVDPDDKGNWFGGSLVGSKYGVTGAALAAHRGVKVVSYTDMAKLTEAEAIEVGLKGYYHVHGIDLLPWDVVTAGLTDLSFNAGPKAAVKVLQRLIGTGDDGDAGPGTREAYRKWRCDKDEAAAARAWTAARIAFYKSLKNPKYINGWTNRANTFLPGTAWYKANVG